MYNYSFFQWILFFYIYCFLGWIIESTIVSVEEKRLVNRGFMRIPLLPIYGSGAIMILFVSLPVRNNPFLVYLLGMTGATILEYFTAWIMETFLKVKYWDYSTYKFNLHGRICLKCSLFWGVLSIALTLFIHRPIEDFVLNLNNSLIIFLLLITSIIFIYDWIYSLINVIGLNKLLGEVTKIKEEIEGLKLQLSRYKININIKEIPSLRGKFVELSEEYEETFGKIKELQSRVFKAYPKATSKYFNEALKEIREKLKK